MKYVIYAIIVVYSIVIGVFFYKTKKESDELCSYIEESKKEWGKLFK